MDKEDKITLNLFRALATQLLNGKISHQEYAEAVNFVANLRSPVEDNRPHSRACGIRVHDHGLMCATDCITCHGKVYIS